LLVLARKRWLLLLMGALVFALPVAKGAAALSAGHLLAVSAKPSKAAKKVRRHEVDPRLIAHLRNVTWRWQRIMGRRPTRLRVERDDARTFAAWRAIAHRTYVAYLRPPHKGGWLCIHRYEGSWQDAGDPYWGGLQMDRGFMASYAPLHLLRRGWANSWSPLEQMWVAERAYRSGRGFYAWPNTARMCGLI
jgi:hypothetical protein